jgi:HlyD family secretion protein
MRIGIGIAIAVVLIGGYSASLMLKPGPKVEVLEISPGKIERYVEERARTSLPHIASLTMPFNGRIAPITIEPGTAVKQDQVVAQLINDDLHAEVAIAEAELGAVNAQLALLADNALEKTALQEMQGWIATMDKVEQASAVLIGANQARADFTDWWAQAEEKLKDQGAVAEEKYRRARTESAEAAVDLAVSQFNQQAVALVASIFDLGPKYIDEYLDLKRLKAAALEQERVAAEARLSEARRRLARAEIKAPMAGVILQRLIESERALPADSLLLTVGDPEQLQITADLLSDDAGLVRVGDRVQVYGPVFGDLQLKGRVHRVDPQGFTKVSSLGVEQQRVRVIIKLEPGELARLAAAGRAVGVEFRAHVRIFTDEAADALAVPRLALVRSSSANGGWALYRIVDGRAQLTPVELGLGNPQQVQIAKGLKAGDQVLISPAKDLKSGDKVTAFNAPAGPGRPRGSG